MWEVLEGPSWAAGLVTTATQEPSRAPGHPLLQQRLWGSRGLGSFLPLFAVPRPGSTQLGLWVLEGISFLLFSPYLVSVYGLFFWKYQPIVFNLLEVFNLQELAYLSSVSSSLEWWVLTPPAFPSLPPWHWLCCSCDPRVSCFHSLKLQKAKGCLGKNTPHPQVLQIAARIKMWF